MLARNCPNDDTVTIKVKHSFVWIYRLVFDPFFNLLISLKLIKKYVNAFSSTHLAVLIGLGSKLPCASTAACFSRVAPREASTKSGGKAPAMAQRHDMAILKRSASYFYRRDRHSKNEDMMDGLSGGREREEEAT